MDTRSDSDTNTMNLSVVILSYRNPPLLRLCLRSLQRALSGSDLTYEVTVVDNATTPETAAVVRQDFQGIFPSLTFIPLAKNTGFTFGVNEGLRAARGDAILSLNHDIIVQPGAIESMLAYARQHPQIGILGPQLLNLDGSHQDSCFRYYTPLIILARRLRLPFTRALLDHFALRDMPLTRPTPVDWISGAAFLVQRDAMERVGLMDEQLFHYFSDVDWSRRFWEHGYGVAYFPQASLYHGLGRASKGRFSLLDPFVNQATRWHIKDAFRYFRKHGTSGTRPLAFGPTQQSLLDA